MIEPTQTSKPTNTSSHTHTSRRAHYIIPIFVPHKGCSHDCIFCNQKKITGSSVEITAKEVKETIDKYLKTINRDNSYVEISFFGGSFTGIPMEYQNELLIVAKEAKEVHLIDAIRLSTRPDYIDKIILDNLLVHGVDIIELGVQSMDYDVLNITERGHTSSDVIAAANLIRSYGFKLGLQMMVGLPLDTIEKDLYTAEEIIKLKPDFCRIYPALVIRGTELENMFNNNKYTPLSVDEAVDICKKLYIEFTINNILIIRIGLQPTAEISLEGDIISGPFHPSFRELIEASIINDMIVYCIKNFYNNIKCITIEINPRDISKLYADKKRYFNTTINTLKSITIKIRQCQALPSLNLRFIGESNEKNMSLYEYINLVK